MATRMKTQKSLWLLASASAIAMTFGVAATSQTFEFSASFDEDEYLRLVEVNTAWSSAVEGATTQRVEQIAAIIANSISLTGDFEAGDRVEIGLNAEIHDHDGNGNEWQLFALNFNVATATAGDSLAGGSQMANIAFNNTAVDSIDEEILLVLDQRIRLDNTDGDSQNEYNGDLEFAAENFLFAGSAVGGNAIIDASMIVDEVVVNGEQVAAITANAASFSTAASDLTIVLADSQGLFGHFDEYDGNAQPHFDDADAQFFASNVAAAFSPTPMFETGDPAVMNLDQLASLSLNSIATRVVGENGDRDFDVVLALNSGVGPDDRASLGQSLSGAGFNELDLAFENFIFAETFVDGQIEGFFDDRTRDDRDFDDNSDRITLDEDAEDALDAAYDIVSGNGWGPFLGRDEIGDVLIGNVEQVAALNLNAISYVGEGTLFIDTYAGDIDVDGPQWDGSYFGSAFAQSLDDLDLDQFGNAAVADTEYGNGTISDLAQVISIRGNTLSSTGDLQFGVNGLLAGGPEDGYAFVQSVDDLVVGSGNENRIALDTEYGNLVIDTVSQVYQVAFNTISAGGSYEIGEGDDVETENFGGNIKGYFVQTVVDMEIDLDNFIDADLGADGNNTMNDLEQILSASVNTFTARADFDGALMQSTTNDDDIDLDIRNFLRSEVDNAGNAVNNTASQTGLLNVNVATITGVASGEILQNLDLNFDDFDNGNQIDVGSSVVMENFAEAKTERGGFASMDLLDQTLSASLNAISLGTLRGGDSLSIEQSVVGSGSSVELSNTALALVDYGVVGFGANDRIATLNDIVQTAVIRVNTISTVPTVVSSPNLDN